MRAPNVMIFLITAVLAFVSACEYVGIPFSIPDIKLPQSHETRDLPRGTLAPQPPRQQENTVLVKEYRGAPT
jgi:hypothetical protein